MPRPPALAAVALWAALCATAFPATAAAASPAYAGGSRVLLVFLPARDLDPDEPPSDLSPREILLTRLDRRPQLSLGLVGATQGRYSQAQALLDITQGTRTSVVAYNPKDPPEMELVRLGDEAYFAGFDDAVVRADRAPAEIYPGLLGGSIPGGAGYVGVDGRAQLEALPAANRAGIIHDLSIGPARDVAERALSMLERRRFVVAGLPTGVVGGRGLDELLAKRAPNELILVVQTPPDRRAPQLMPAGVLGLGPPHALRSATTRLDGVVAGIDILPTVFKWLGVDIPDHVKGQQIELDGKRDADALTKLSDRLGVVNSRRIPALLLMMLAWATLTLALGVFDTRGGVRAGMRVGALAMFWVLPVLLVTAAIAPSRTAEMAILAGGTIALGALTDRFVGWPRAPFVPAAIAVISYVVDLARGSPLIIRSLLGPNPRFGSRYWGIGNELEATLPILLFIAIAAYLGSRARTNGRAATFAGFGVLLGAAIGSGRLGADVGGVMTVGAGAAAATVAMLPGGVTRRAVLIAILAPALALAGLAGLDLATGGNGHFTRSVLHASGSGALWDTFVRRYELAFGVFKRGLMPFVTVIAGLVVLFGLRHRDRLFAPLRGAPAWNAALVASIASAVAGTLFNDSGPLLLAFGAFLLACVAAYVGGEPRSEGTRR
jgi:hypothetical protein